MNTRENAGPSSGDRKALTTTHKNADDELVAANLVRPIDLTIGVVNRHAVVEATYSRVYDGQHHCERRSGCDTEVDEPARVVGLWAHEL